MTDRLKLVDLTDPTAVLRRLASLRLEGDSLHDRKAAIESQLEANRKEWLELEPVAAHYLGERATTVSAYNSVEMRAEDLILTSEADGWVEVRREAKPWTLEPLTAERALEIQADAAKAAQGEAAADGLTTRKTTYSLTGRARHATPI